MKKPSGSTNKQLAKLIEMEIDLTRETVGTICGVTKACVDMWLRPKGSPNWREMPERSLRLLEFELGRRLPQHTAAQRRSRQDLEAKYGAAHE